MDQRGEMRYSPLPRPPCFSVWSDDGMAVASCSLFRLSFNRPAFGRSPGWAKPEPFNGPLGLTNILLQPDPLPDP